MSRIPDQHQVPLVEARRHIQINRAPQVHSREVADGEQMWDGLGPMPHQFLYVYLALRASFAGRREALPVDLQVPDHMIAVHRQNADRKPASAGMKLIEVPASPAHRLR